MYNVFEKTIDQLQADMESGVTTSEEITFSYLQRIADLDQNGPKTNAVIEINPDAVFIAQALDRERKISGSRGPMHGIPVLIKDNISTGDKMHTTAGSVAFSDHFALSDAPVVKQLRKAGAVLLGKTNLSEFARYMTTEVPNGYSSRGGQTMNPHGETLDPLGSSTGSGVAAAMSYSAVTVGTETSGSIISPSSANSVVGLKPTVGCVSRSGIIPINSQDTAGPMGRTVRDVAILFGAMTGSDEEDPATLSTEQVVFQDYLPFLDKNALKGKRIGVGIPQPEKDWLSKEQIDQYLLSLSYLEKAGAVLVPDCNLPEVNMTESTLTEPVLQYEFKRYMDAYLAKYCSLASIRTLHDIVEYNKAHPDIALRYGQDILEECDKNTSGTLTESLYLTEKCRVVREAGRDGIDRIMADKQLDLLVWPAASGVPPICGYPMLSIPAGKAADGKMIGLSMIASAFEEPKLLACGYAFEQISGLRVIPEAAKAE